MKKLLLATTALVASTAFAMADVDLSGSAEMGVLGGENPDGTDKDGQFHTDIDIDFSMSGETDAGLTFGASVDLDSTADDDAFGNTRGVSDANVFVSGAYGTLTMGDTDGALDFVMQEAIIGSTIDDVHEMAGYNGNSGLDGFYDAQVARYDYSFGDFSVALSAEIDDDSDSSDGDLFDIDLGNLDDTFDDIEDDTVLGIGARYSGEFGGFGFGAGLGYQQAGDAEITGLSLDMSSGGFRAILNYSDYNMVPLTVGTVQEGDLDANNPLLGVGEANNTELDSHVGLALGYQAGALLVAANYGEFDTDQGDVSGYGVVANYDLGGGASLQGGYARSDYSDIGGQQDTDNYSFGIAMSF